MNHMTDNKIVYWHLPGFCAFRFLNQIFINLMHDYPDKFRPGYRIGSVYGSFPGAIWNGGRAVFGITYKADMERLIKTYNDKGVPVRFTWTNSLLEEKHLNDTYCNLIMRVADNGLNQVLANTEILENYIRENYPKYPIISSTTKRMTDMEALKDELGKDYHLVVLDYDLNHNEEALQAMEPYADKLEILVNEICYPGCKMRKEHYRSESQSQLEFDNRSDFRCPNKSTPRVFKECMDRPAFISNEEIGSYIDRGFVNFKIVGRGLPPQLVMDSYLYYLPNEKDREFIKAKADEILADIAKAQQMQRR